jgi:hypothetical protein
MLVVTLFHTFYILVRIKLEVFSVGCQCLVEGLAKSLAEDLAEGLEGGLAECLAGVIERPKIVSKLKLGTRFKKEKDNSNWAPQPEI